MTVHLFSLMSLFRRRRQKIKSPGYPFCGTGDISCFEDVMDEKLVNTLRLRLLEQTLTKKEIKKISEWIDKSPENSVLYKELLNRDKLDLTLKEFGEPDTERSLEIVKKRLFSNS